MKTTIIVLILAGLLTSCNGGGGAGPAATTATPVPTPGTTEVFELYDVVAGYVAPKNDMGDFEFMLTGFKKGGEKELIKGQIATAETEGQMLTCWVDIEYMHKYVESEGTYPNMNIYIVYVSNTLDYPANLDECTNIEGTYQMELVSKYSVRTKFTILE